MKIQLRGHNFELSETNRQYAMNKVSHLERFFQKETITGTITVKKFQRTIKVEVMLSDMKHLHIRAEEMCEDFYLSVDTVVEKLEKQIRKYKTKIQKRYQDKLPLPKILLNSENKSISDEIVRTKEIEIAKPMSLDEAILQMDLLGHSFYIFKDQSSLMFNILYRRNEGDLGLIKLR